MTELTREDWERVAKQAESLIKEASLNRLTSERVLILANEQIATFPEPEKK